MLFWSLDLGFNCPGERSIDSEGDGVGETEGVVETVGLGVGDELLGPVVLCEVLVSELLGRSETVKVPIWSKCV